ncbi:MAG TPA: DUF4956 domain-containing protein [Bryobacteraceae bacterium]|nr:DUF4956 domain-containing protein [Bryobacteraceae bacterium]
MPEFLTHALASEHSADPAEVAARLVASLLLGWLVAWVYSRTTRGEESAASLPTTLVLLCVLIAMVTQVIGDNVARAFSLVGALSIVRFRTVVRDTRDTAFVIFAVVVGMATGSQHPWVAILGILVCGGAAFLLAKTNKQGAAPGAMVLRLRFGAGIEMEPVLAQVLGGSARRLLLLATAKQGTALEAVYEVHLAEGLAPEAVVKQLHRMEGIYDVRLAAPDTETE